VLALFILYATSNQTDGNGRSSLLETARRWRANPGGTPIIWSDAEGVNLIGTLRKARGEDAPPGLMPIIEALATRSDQAGGQPHAAAAAERWLSMVTMTTRTVGLVLIGRLRRLPSIVGLRFVEGFHGDGARRIFQADRDARSACDTARPSGI